ncbi:MAG TPA: FecR domain-containing protein [Verrucomicrobiae bacterium]|jgi:hypothetical protein
MKNLTTLFATAFLTAAFSFSASAQATVPGCATIVRVQGLASYSLDNTTWRPLLPGKVLSAGAVIRTGESSSVDVVLGKSIQFPQSHKQPDRISSASDSPVRGLVSPAPAAEQNVIRLTSGTVLAIDKLNTTDTGADTVGDTELDLKQGRIFASVKKLNATSQYLVRIPSGIAGVRGTKFSLGADGSTAVLESTSGGLVLTVTIGNVSKTFQIAAGESLDPNANSPTPLPSGIQQLLQQNFSVIGTVYYENLNYNEKNKNEAQEGNGVVPPTS